jgi:polysaccharide deacetylase 2 family uncharacterized protein YibQ
MLGTIVAKVSAPFAGLVERARAMLPGANKAKDIEALLDAGAAKAKKAAEPPKPRDLPTTIVLLLAASVILGLGGLAGWMFSDPTARDPGEPSVLAPAKPAPPPPMTNEDAEAMPMEVAPASADAPIGMLALRAVPVRAITEQGADGLLPVISPDGKRAWKIYARPDRSAPGRPKIAIYVGGLGLNPKATEAALARLPGQVSLGLSAMAPDLPALVTKARAKGHEILMDLPMEPADVAINDPGPYTMLTTVSATENIGRLEWIMSRAPGFVGMAATLGDRFMLEEGAARPVLESLRGRGLLILDTRALPRSVIARLSDGIGLPYGIANVTLDDDPAPAAILAKLTKLEDLARAQGSAIGVGRSYPVTNDIIDKWARGVEGRNIQLAPISALMVGGN